MSKSVAYRHYLRVISQWPKDNLRPECQLQDALRRRVDRVSDTGLKKERGAAEERADLEVVNALYSLLENRYVTKYPIRGSLMKPASNPSHYTDLIKELEAAPTRTWWATTVNRWKGFLRFQ